MSNAVLVVGVEGAALEFASKGLGATAGGDSHASASQQGRRYLGAVDLDNKYYHATVHLHSCSVWEATEQEAVWDDVQAVLLLVDRAEAGVVANNAALKARVAEAPCEIKMCCLLPSPNQHEDSSAVSQLDEWCMDEFVELVHLHEPQQQQAESGAHEHGAFSEKVGADRVLEALEAHMWPLMTHKPRNQPQPQLNPQPHPQGGEAGGGGEEEGDEELAQGGKEEPGPKAECNREKGGEGDGREKKGEEEKRADDEEGKGKGKGQKRGKAEEKSEGQRRAKGKGKKGKGKKGKRAKPRADQPEERRNPLLPPAPNEDDELQALFRLVSEVREFRQANPNNLKEAHARAEAVLMRLAAMGGESEGDEEDADQGVEGEGQ